MNLLLYFFIISGDLHGNLPDLLGFERVLWNLGPALSPSTLLFLGDYVDRGPHGVEVIIRNIDNKLIKKIHEFFENLI